MRRPLVFVVRWTWLTLVGCVVAGSWAVFPSGGHAQEAEALPGPKKLEMTEPLDVVMVNGIDRFALRELADSPKRRDAQWKRDYSSAEAYANSIAPISINSSMA